MFAAPDPARDVRFPRASAPPGWHPAGVTFDLDFAARYRAVRGRDSRFDGWFFTAVTSTGIYCRPSCPATTPRPEHVRFFPTAAAAQEAGFRACKRCIPGAVPGSPAWDLKADLAGRAMRLIADGVVEREGVPGLARHLGYSERQLRRHLLADLGAGPLALARAQRAHVARLLLETTDLPVTDVAFAAGFGSLRQFNATIREVFGSAPTELRAAPRSGGAGPGGRIVLRLARREPFAWDALLAFLAARAVPGVEEAVGGSFRRSLRLPHGPAVVELSDDGDAVRATLALADPRDLGPAVARCRRLLDLDADPVAVAEALGGDPLLGALVRAVPGRRSPGTVDGPELAIRAVLGQGVSVAAARSLVGQLVAAHGTPLPAAHGGVTHLFPAAADLAAADLAAADLAALPVPAARRAAVGRVAAAVADGVLDLAAGADRGDAVRRLLGIRGVGPWTAAYVAMRALGDPDAFPPGDAALRRAITALGGPSDAGGIAELAPRWRPWRAYAVHHLWASLPPAGPAAARASATLHGGRS
jgi:AraC family transcriptional regulator of adaptative response / DNA-3-methyladenine glycosylase II